MLRHLLSPSRTSASDYGLPALAVGTLAANQTTFSYDLVNRITTTTSDLNTNNDNGLISKMLYDGLGRTTETRQ
ncbi:MAG TPA: hypothetical protein VLB68_31630 [Pyrinomonadaceae bacterium]|nr:hypothetical protein [Pyrinomonadaceae bacterium]